MIRKINYETPSFYNKQMDTQVFGFDLFAISCMDVNFRSVAEPPQTN